jgi:uncharacterized protein (TIGR03067 family)
MLVLTVGLLVAADDQAKEDTKGLQGSWVLVSGEQGGETLPKDVVKAGRLTIQGTKHTVRVGKDKIVGTHELEPTKTPKAIDSTETEGPDKGHTIHGIYELEKGRFKVCFAAPAKERPTEFTTKSGTGNILHVWRRGGRRD